VKKDYSNIHPELQQLARKFPAMTVSKNNLWLMRWLVRLTPPSKKPEDVIIKNIFIPGQDDQPKIRLRKYTPKTTAERTPVLIWLHGGGYVMGKPEMDDHVCSTYVHELGIVVVSVDYRYAPKNPFPAGLEDSYAALLWVASHAQQLGIDEKRIAIGGGSAGGGLTAALVQRAYDRQEITPVFQLLVYPMLDDRTCLRTDDGNNYYQAWNLKSNQFGWMSYLGKNYGAEEVPPYAVPARRHDLSGLPPAWIGVGSLDLFYDEAKTYAQRLTENGVNCEIKVVPDAFHGFDVFDYDIPIVKDFRTSQFAALKKYLFPISSDQA
jgi:acetyl esterase/lipase